jgi:uncharacterized membrane protein YfcA
LLTLLAALPTRLLTLKPASLTPFLYATTALGLGAVLGGYAGVSGLRRLSPVALTRAVFALLLALGLVMISEAAVCLAPNRHGTKFDASQNGLRACVGFLIGAASGLLGVAAREVIIPTSVLGFGAPIKAVLL